MTDKETIVRKLKIIQGQLSGIIKLIEADDVDCEKVMHQMKAAKNGFQALGGAVAQNYLKKCFVKKENQEEEIGKIFELMTKF